jgi:hypothetical protein
MKTQNIILNSDYRNLERRERGEQKIEELSAETKRIWLLEILKP